MSKNEKSGSDRRFLRYLKRYSAPTAAAVVFAGVSAVLMLYIPILAGSAIDCMIGAGSVDFDAIKEIITKTLIAVGAAALCQWVMNIITNNITCGVVRDVRNDAFAKLGVLPMKYADSHPAGETVNRIISDTEQFADGLLMGFTQFFTGIVTIVGTLVFMLTISWKIALLVAALTPLSLFAAKFIAEHTHDMFLSQSEVRGEQTAFVNEMISGLKVVRAYSHEEDALADFDEINGRLENTSRRAVFFSSLTNPCTRFINNTIYAFVGLAGAFAVISGAGAFTVGRLVSFLSYANQYTKPFNEISGVITELQNALTCASRVFDLIDEQPEPAAVNEGIDPGRLNGDVRFSGVSFSYSPERPLIEDLTLEVKQGCRAAIVGPTGCGKTTLINLIMRFYDVDGGSVSVDGTDIRELSVKALRSNIGMVLQETWLRSGTIRENITMGKPDATDEEVIAAAKAAHSYGFIRRLPDGFDTCINEDGGSLSQGQKQLLCITRVMLRKPPMLILDEATSSIDTRTELKIQDAFAELMKGRTSFIVAHRLSTIREADVIIVMNKGHIVEMGKHDELLARGGSYAKLYNSQFAL